MSVPVDGLVTGNCDEASEQVSILEWAFRRGSSMVDLIGAGGTREQLAEKGGVSLQGKGETLLRA
jgi:hypothetical protein